MGRGVGGGSKGIGVMGKMGNDGTSFSTVPVDYQLLEEIGQGGSATVYRAIYLPLNEVVAIKCVDLDRCNSNLDDIRREAQTMSLIEHANVVTAYCTFVVDRCLWVVMPFMAVGSCFHIMKTAYPDGFEEPVIGSILKETLKALEYLHRHGHIHRDIKAANILLDSNGFVKLGDFGVSACMFDKGDRQHSRNTFVGTPCWMAPEVLQKDSGYNFKADIWSFGITALELAHCHAPFSKYPPMKVLLMTIQNAPPGLDYERDKKFSKSFKEMVAMCLVKDQTKRSTAEKLLKHSFFKNAKPPEMSLKNLLLDLPPLWDRMKALQLKDAEQLALKRMPSFEQEAVSQNEYNRGVSAWNFDIQDLKAQASLIQDDELQLVMSEEDERLRSLHDKHSSFSRPPLSFIADSNEAYRGSSSSTSLESKCLNKKNQNIMSESTCPSNGPHCVSQCAALKDDMERISGVENKGKNSFRYQNPKSYENEILLPSKVVHLDQDSRPERSEGNNLLMPEKILKRDDRKASAVSVPLMLPRRASMNNLSAPNRTSAGYRDTHEDKSKSNVVQIKGRFSVTSENVDAVKDVPLGTISRRSTQGSPLRKSASVGNWHAHTKPMPVTFKEIGELPVSPSVLLTHLQNLLQQTESQQDLLMGLIDSLQQNELANGRLHLQVPTPDSGALNEALPSEREKLLLTNISALQNRVSKLTDELAAEKAKHLHLQQQLDGTPDRVKAGTRQGEKSES